ncbi:MAG TPA: hypothetical protein VFG20_00205 [Planctomycetaceae bacterium]|nr:hypothetical protein [Planctomycetaceae bacterium]
MASLQFSSLLFVMVALGVLLLFGVLAIWLRSTGVASVCEVIAHGGIGLAGIIYLYLIVPKVKGLFIDFGMEVPAMAMLLINLSDLMVNYWYIPLFGLVSFSTLDVLAFATFHRVPESRYVARIFSGLITVGLLVLSLMISAAILAAEASLLQRL